MPPRSSCGNIRRGFGFQCQSCPIPYSAPDSGLSSVLGSGVRYVLMCLLSGAGFVLLCYLFGSDDQLSHKGVLLKKLSRASGWVVEDARNEETSQCCLNCSLGT